MKLSVIILNYNVRYFLELCLKSVQEAIKNIDAEIIVVDNNSEDDSCDMVKALFPEVNLIENKTNFGFSKGNNIGVLQAKGEYLCILNPDTVVAEDVFTKMLNFSETKENLGIIGCKLINGAGHFLPESKRNIPYVKAAFKKLLGNPAEYYANHLSENDLGEVDVLVGAFMFLKKDVYNEIEGFDEDYFMYGEDIDISYKSLKSGYRNYYFGETTIVHFKGESTLKDKFYAQRFYGAMQIFYKKHFKKNFFFDLFVSIGIKLVYMLRREPVNKVKDFNMYVLFSNKINESLKSVLTKTIVLNSNFDEIDNNSEVIFDANVLTYKQIISFMENKNEDKSFTYKILPKSSKFVLGSNNAISQGEVITFD